MKIGEFIDKYCQDILKKSELAKKVVDDSEYSYDVIIQGEDGEDIKVIYAGAHEIPIVDILTLGEDDFRKTYKSPDAFEAYKQYLDAFIILEGEEVLSKIRNDIQASKEKIKRYAALDLDDMTCSFTS